MMNTPWITHPRVEFLSLFGTVVGVLAGHILAPYRRLRATQSDSIADPFAIRYVDPATIEYQAGQFTNLPHRYGGQFSLADTGGAEVRDGDWDRQRIRVEEMPKFQAVEKRLAGASWEETGIYDIQLKRIERVGSYDGCQSRADLEARYETIDTVIDSIRKDGYQETDAHEQITINIGRDGDLLFASDGSHRLSAAKILEIDEIPVRVLVRHRRWQNLRDHVANCSSYEILNDRARKHLSHPDLRDILLDDSRSI